MRNSALLVISVFMVALTVLSTPSILTAGQGAEVWYGAYFNDNDSLTGTQLKYVSHIRISNPNNYPATVKVSYYELDGTTDAFGDYTAIHAIPANDFISIRPNNDLSASDYEGSYTVEALEGSVTVSQHSIHRAGDSLGDTVFPEDHGLNMFTVPVHTVTATFMSLDYYNELDFETIDDMATQDEEVITWIMLNNPSDKLDAEATITLGDAGFTNFTTFTLTFDPHQTHVFNPYDYGINGQGTTPAKGTMLVDVTKGGLIGHYNRALCDDLPNNNLSYRSYAGYLNKRNIIK